MDTIKIDRYEGIRHQVQWLSDDVPVDLTGMHISIIDASPASLKQGTISIESGDRDEGKATLNIPSELFSDSMIGRSCWIRLCLHRSDGSKDTTPPIWIEIK